VEYSFYSLNFARLLHSGDNIRKMIEYDSRSFGNDRKYIVDPSLPGVVKHFRLLGIDCAYEPTYTDAYILHLARTEDRFIITRSSKLVNKLQTEQQKIVNRSRKLEKWRQELEQYRSSHREQEIDEDTLEFMEERIELIEKEVLEQYAYSYYWVNSLGRKEQLLEVVNALRIIFIPDRLFKRCSKCNGENQLILDKSILKGRVHDCVYDENDQFSMCSKCGWITWGTIEQNAKNPAQVYIYQNAIRFCKQYSYNPE
jgi:uncharacterized protein with PIN domain